MRTMKRLLLLCLALLVGGLAGCAGLGALKEKPEVSLAGVELQEFALFEQRFGIKLRIRNPNDVDLPISALVFDVELNGQPFARGMSNKAVTVPRYGEAVLEASAVSQLGGMLRQFREWQKAQREGAAVTYRIVGHLELGGFGGLGSLPFERQGEVQLPTFDPPAKKKPLPGEI